MLGTLLAIRAAEAGDSAAALVHISKAKAQSRAAARRQRQIVEIAALIVAEQDGRAAGLALVHLAEFPGDAELLAAVTATTV